MCVRKSRRRKHLDLHMETLAWRQARNIPSEWCRENNARLGAQAHVLAVSIPVCSVGFWKGRTRLSRVLFWSRCDTGQKISSRLTECVNTRCPRARMVFSQDLHDILIAHSLNPKQRLLDMTSNKHLPSAQLRSLSLPWNPGECITNQSKRNGRPDGAQCR
jgi:hypothetical protein